MTHELKTWPLFFNALWDGSKTFEVRKNDRCFAVGQSLELREYSADLDSYSGRSIDAVITYVMHGGQFGIDSNYCVLGIRITATHPASPLGG